VQCFIPYSGNVKDASGKAHTGAMGLTFALYELQEGGSPLFVETQNLQLDEQGHYTVLLGATQAEGLPLDLFTSGKARWLGVTPQLSAVGEQPRVLLVGVPYALKAADADTLGGKPASAFVTTQAVAPSGDTGTQAAPQSLGVAAGAASAAQALAALPITGMGTTNFIPIWTSSTNLGNSTISEVAGKVNVKGTLQLPATGTATATGGKNSQPASLQASAFNSSTQAAVNQTFNLQAEPTGNNTSSPSGKLNLLFGSGSGTPAETGLSIANNGSITFAPGQTFPGAGTLSGVTAGTDLTGGGTSGNVTLNLNLAATDARYAQLGTANTFTGAQSFNGNLTDTGNISATGQVSGGSGLFFGDVDANGTVFGANARFTGLAFASQLAANTSSGDAVFGNSTGGTGVRGTSQLDADFQAGIFGAEGGTTKTLGVFGLTDSPSGAGVLGQSGGASAVGAQFAPHAGVWADTVITGNNALLATADDGFSLQAVNNSSSRGTIFAQNLTSSPAFVLEAQGSGGACDIDNGGNLICSGGLFGSSKSFKIDHPLDPANKYLVHASVESSEMKNIYDGVVITDAHGEATVSLPEWFEALNTDFRYQLTVVGQFAQAIVAREIENHQFQIKTNAPNVKVSWQVTGVRQDAYAKAHPLVVEQQKDEQLRGFYIHPELYGAPNEKQIWLARNPGAMKHIKEQHGEAAAAAKP